MADSQPAAGATAAAATPAAIPDPARCVPCGPCANRLCPHKFYVNLRCDCNGDAAAGKTPLCRPHHIFDPGCNVKSAKTPLKHLSTNMGAAFWDGIGQVFRYDLRKVVETRVKMIGQKQITPLTPWVDDWHNNVPEWLRRFIVAALASRGETYASKDISDRRREQKFRERYAILMFMLRSINPRCSEPLHNALHRLSFFSGDSWVFRKILARLNVLPSEENARMQRKYAALETLEARKLWILDMLSKGYYIMFGDDNLDWRNPGSRIHVWQQQKGNIGVHILNRQVMAMDAPPGVENLDDEFVLRKEISYV